MPDHDQGEDGAADAAVTDPMHINVDTMDGA
jgi:hypothetical protein